tara:strand:- start:3076 stop:4680 length:1605 start_codon:yes stop_codon:yes gene_type:complete
MKSINKSYYLIFTFLVFGLVLISCSEEVIPDPDPTPDIQATATAHEENLMAIEATANAMAKSFIQATASSMPTPTSTSVPTNTPSPTATVTPQPTPVMEETYSSKYGFSINYTAGWQMYHWDDESSSLVMFNHASGSSVEINIAYAPDKSLEEFTESIIRDNKNAGYGERDRVKISSPYGFVSYGIDWHTEWPVRYVIFKNGDWGISGRFLVNGDHAEELQPIVDTMFESIKVFPPTLLLPPATPVPASTSGYGSWSPDGNSILFVSGIQNGYKSIYSMNLDGSKLVKLTDKGDALRASWSPDGTKIVFDAHDYNGLGLWNIYIMNPDGSGVEQLTKADRSINVMPMWSPDGSKIAFASGRSGEDGEIYLINADGSNEIQITDNEHEDLMPNWCSNGYITFTSLRDGYKRVYVMRADGSDEVLASAYFPHVDDFDATAAEAVDEEPAWSPDCSQIAFSSDRDGDWDIYVASDNGSVKNITVNEFYIDGYPQWSPDGTKILFHSHGRNRTFAYLQVWVMNSDGSEVKALTDYTTR